MIGKLQASLGQYFDFKLMGFFRDSLTPIINQYTPDTEDKSKIYRHIFLAPSAIGKRRSFQVSGVQFPYVALWATSALKWASSTGYSPFYSLGAVERDLTWEEPNPDNPDKPIVKYARGMIEHFERKYELSCASYFRTFTESVNQSLLEADRLRYFKMPFHEIHPYFYTGRMELFLDDLITSEKFNEQSEQRIFQLAAKYTFRATVPIIPLHQDEMFDRLQIFLNEQKIYEAAIMPDKILVQTEPPLTPEQAPVTKDALVI